RRSCPLYDRRARLRLPAGATRDLERQRRHLEPLASPVQRHRRIDAARDEDDRLPHTRDSPPSRMYVCPVTQSFPARNRASSATSSGLPKRPTGIAFSYPRRVAAESHGTQPVSIDPSAMQFTWIRGASSIASDFVIPRIPALATE